MCNVSAVAVFALREPRSMNGVGELLRPVAELMFQFDTGPLKTTAPPAPMVVTLTPVVTSVMLSVMVAIAFGANPAASNGPAGRIPETAFYRASGMPRRGS